MSSQTTFSRLLPRWLVNTATAFGHDPPPVTLDRPVFLVGCGKSGTSMLGVLLMAHPDVGPKPELLRCLSAGLQDQVDAMLDDAIFGKVAAAIEQKAVWDRFFPIRGVPLRVGRELTLLKNPLSEKAQRQLRHQLTQNFRQRRFFSKAPFNTFRLHVLRELFPDARLIAIHRDGRDVVASWGRKQNRWQTLGGYEAAIRLFAAKWNESVEHIEACRHKLDVKVIRYEDLVAAPQRVLTELLNFCSLSVPAGLYDSLRLDDRTGLWRERIPEAFHSLVESLTSDNRQRLAA
ncbi:MAG: sulfotransferase [Fuerstiella sp.]